MDITYIGRPHEYNPRRVYGMDSVDWQSRMEPSRLRQDRLKRAKDEMAKHDLGALLLFVGENVRYVTGVWQGTWKSNIFIRYCILPRGGEPILFETVGADMEAAIMDAPWLEGRIRPAITWKWAGPAEDMMAKRMAESVLDALKEHGLQQEKVGIDIMDMMAFKALNDAGIKIVNAWPAMSAARTIKTPDELELLKQATAIGDATFEKIREEWLKPGVKESEIAGKVADFLFENGFETISSTIVASGGNTNPYRRWHSDKIIRRGDLVIIDLVNAGPGGYFTDYVRTFCVGGKPTQQLKDLYKECYESMYAAINEMKPGATTADVAKHMPYYDDDKYKTVSLFQFGHSVGLSLYEGMWISRAYSLEYPREIEQNMYFSLETYSGKPGLDQAVRLEESFVITENGYQCFTLFPFEEDMLS